VHYSNHDSPDWCHAAITTAVGETETNENNLHGDGTFRHALWLAVFDSTGMSFRRQVLQDENGHADGTWHWPERA
jgi:hypothetical protein